MGRPKGSKNKPKFTQREDGNYEPDRIVNTRSSIVNLDPKKLIDLTPSKRMVKGLKELGLKVISFQQKVKA